MKRGDELPQTKLTEDDVRLLRQCGDEYQRLKRQAD